MRIYGTLPGQNGREIYMVEIDPSNAFIYTTSEDRASGIAHPDSFSVHLSPIEEIPSYEPVPTGLLLKIANPPQREFFPR